MSRNPSPASDPTPSLEQPTTEPEPTSPMTSLLFQAQSEGPTTSPETESSSPDPQPWDGPAESDSHDPDAATPSARRSTAERKARRKVRELLPMTKAAVETAGGVVHTVLTQEDTAERAYGLYLPDEEDVDAIAEPLAGLASRRMPEGAENPDVADLFQLAMGLARYVVKQLAKRAAIAREYQATLEPEDAAA